MDGHAEQTDFCRNIESGDCFPLGEERVAFRHCTELDPWLAQVATESSQEDRSDARDQCNSQSAPGNFLVNDTRGNSFEQKDNAGF
jgi:hypothetical protein